MLELEFTTFKKMQAQLQKEYPEGGCVVIKGSEVIGIWKERLEALRESYKIFGKGGGYLVKNIQDDLNDVHYFTRTLEFSHAFPNNP